jgi:hypothetical protein
MSGHHLFCPTHLLIHYAYSFCLDVFNTKYPNSFYSIAKVRAEEIKHGQIVHKPSAHTTGAYVWKISWVITFRSLITDFNRKRD